MGISRAFYSQRYLSCHSAFDGRQTCNKAELRGWEMGTGSYRTTQRYRQLLFAYACFFPKSENQNFYLNSTKGNKIWVHLDKTLGWGKWFL